MFARDREPVRGGNDRDLDMEGNDRGSSTMTGRKSGDRNKKSNNTTRSQGGRSGNGRSSSTGQSRKRK
jgi:hypothetical protein